MGCFEPLITTSMCTGSPCLGQHLGSSTVDRTRTDVDEVGLLALLNAGLVFELDALKTELLRLCLVGQCRADQGQERDPAVTQVGTSPQATTSLDRTGRGTLRKLVRFGRSTLSLLASIGDRLGVFNAVPVAIPAS
jgi:hypothetical protein